MDKQQEGFKKEICNVVTRINALKFGVFTLSNDQLSPYYVDLRIVTSFPETFVRIEKLYQQVVMRDPQLKENKRIAGIPTAGTPFAAVLAFYLKKPFLYVRKDTTHGRQRRVEGILNPGDTVLLIDDLITTGKTIITTADAIRSEGGIVNDALVLIDRQEGGEAALRDQKIRLHAIIRMSEAAKIFYDMGSIDKNQLNSILKQIVL